MNTFLPKGHRALLLVSFHVQTLYPFYLVEINVDAPNWRHLVEKFTSADPYCVQTTAREHMKHVHSVFICAGLGSTSYSPIGTRQTHYFRTCASVIQGPNMLLRRKPYDYNQTREVTVVVIGVNTNCTGSRCKQKKKRIRFV